MDQATRLRELITQKKLMSHDSDDVKKIRKNNTRVICVTSGKGGVGKTNFTANLAISLSNQDKKVVVIDADLGLANVDVVLGVISKYTLLDVINHNKDITEIMNTGPNGIKIISGGSGITDLVDMSKEKLNILIAQFNKIYDNADIILIDTGAGLSKSVLSFVFAAEEVIVVTTAEPTSLTDAYAMIKNIALSDKDKKIKVIINRVENVAEGKIAFEKLRNACEKFLNTKIEKLGFLADDSNVSKAVKLQRPFVIEYPNAAISRNIKIIALKLTNSIAEEKDYAKSESFISRVIGLFR